MKFQPGFRSIKESLITIFIVVFAASILTAAAKPKPKRNGFYYPPNPCLVGPLGSSTCEFGVMNGTNTPYVKCGVPVSCSAGTFPNMCNILVDFWVERWNGKTWVTIPSSNYNTTIFLPCDTPFFNVNVLWLPSNYVGSTRGVLIVTREVDNSYVGMSVCYSD
jgi:hypothetical protein